MNKAGVNERFIECRQGSQPQPVAWRRCAPTTEEPIPQPVAWRRCAPTTEEPIPQPVAWRRCAPVTDRVVEEKSA